MLITSLLKGNQLLATFSLGFFSFLAITNISKQTHSYGSLKNYNVLSQGSRAQLKETLTSIMAIQTKLKHQHLKSFWLVRHETGNTVCGVV